MTHREAIALLDNPVLRGLTGRPHWADLGCGAGVFTLALANFLPTGSTIDAIDLNPGIAKQTTNNNVTIQPRTADFTKLNLADLGAPVSTHSFSLPTSPSPGLIDGILMANALHYVKNQPALLQRLHTALKPGGIFLLVEYDTDIPLPRWVPYPLSFTTATHLFAPPHWQTLQKANERPSAFGRSTLYTAYTTAS